MPVRLLYIVENLDRTFVNTNVGSFVRSVSSLGWKVEILTTYTHENQDIEEFVDGVGLKRVASIDRIPPYLLRQRDTYDAVFSYNGRRHNYVLPLLKLFYGKQYIIKTDSIIGWDVAGLRQLVRSWLLIGAPLKLADLILVETPGIEAKIIGVAHHQRVLVLPNCIPLERFLEFERRFAFSGISQEKRYPFILYVGRVSPEKGIDVLIDAFAIVANAYPEWRVRIVGPVSDAGYFRELVWKVSEMGLEDRIEFAGEAYGEALYRWYFMADIFCLPSRREGMPNALTEAMFFGKPIISAQVGQVSYQLDDGRCGVMFPAGDQTELARSMAGLMSQPARCLELGKHAKQRACELFDERTRYESLTRVLHHWRAKD